jgi:ubiquinone/menaquinone biosynthesis C-methylase UbiE
MSPGGWLFASLYDVTTSAIEAAGLGEHRRNLLAGAKGSVLEIGAGTGVNVALYGDRVDELTVTEPEPAMIHRLERRIRQHAQGALVLRAPAEDLPFANDAFDVAVSTLVLCTVDDQPRALRELHRVLRPGGALLFIEHIRAEQPRLARWQDRLNGVNRVLGHGCNCNRPTLHQISSAGFTVRHVEHHTLHKASPIVRPLVVGTAEVSKN